MTKETDAGVSANLYELMLILNPDLRESEVKKKLKEIVDAVEKGNGKVVHEDFWGKKPMAYRLKKKDEGIYMIYNLELPSEFLAELRHMLRIEKEVLRSLIIKLPKGYTYTKYDLEAAADEEKKERRSIKKNISIKHNAPVVTPVKKVKKEETKEVDESALDKKLDEIIGGEDLNL